MGAILRSVTSDRVPDLLERAYLELREDMRRFVARRAPADVVDDLCQEIFVRMHESAAALRDVDRLAPWAFRIARSVVTDHLRRRKLAVPLDDVEEPAAEPPEPKNFNEELGRSFRAMLAMLPPEYAEALELTEMQGVTQAELAARMNLSLSGAKSRVQRGRKLLEGVVRACCDFDLDARGNVLSCAPRAGRDCKDC